MLSTIRTLFPDLLTLIPNFLPNFISLYGKQYHVHFRFFRYGGGYDLAARRKNATRESTATLKAWLNEHKKNPYPTKGEKIMLAIITKMTLTQVRGQKRYCFFKENTLCDSSLCVQILQFSLTLLRVP